MQCSLLPCINFILIDVLFGFSFYTADKSTLTCPECRKEVDVPDRGVRAFTDNKYVEDLLKMKRTHQCMKHFLSLHLYCDNKDCQEQICPSCVVVKHHGPGHKIIELEDKANSIKADMSNTREHVRELSIALGSHLDELNKAVTNLDANVDRDIKAVEKTKDEMYAKIQKLLETVQAEIEKQKIELLKSKENVSKDLNQAIKETTDSKSNFDELYMDIEKKVSTLSNNEIVDGRGSVEKEFMQMKVNELANKSYEVNVHSLTYTKPDLKLKFNFEELGKLCPKPVSINISAKIGESRPQSLVPEANYLGTVDTGFATSAQTVLGISGSGHLLVSGKIEERNLLKCESIEGKALWGVYMGQNDKDTIKGLCCVKGIKEYLIVTAGKRIELRDPTDGSLKSKQEVDFDPGQVCPMEDKKFVVFTSGSKLLIFNINEEKQRIELTKKTVPTDMTDAESLTVVNHQGMKLIIVAAWFPNPVIEAVDFESGKVAWKITERDETQIRPHGLCSDNMGNLFVGDTTNDRVLLLFPDGKLKKELVKMVGLTKCIAFDKARRRLFVNYQNTKEMVGIFEIHYVLG